MKHTFYRMMPLLNKFLGSVLFFRLTVGVFFLGAVYIAATSVYPMAFDEEFHYGLLKIYASSWLPYGIEHTRDMAQFGSATGDPSYLFHYLMSFPYRLLNAFGVPDGGIIISLRLLNVGFVVLSLFLFVRAFKEAGLRPRIINIGMMLLCMIPVFSMLAAQINYDNLLLVVVALATVLTIRLTNEVLQRKRIRSGTLLLLIITILFGMSIKYAFLPIAAALGMWLIGLSVYNWRLNKLTPVVQILQFASDLLRLSVRVKIGLAVLGALSLFFAAHYGTNAVQYGNPIPDCAQVFDENACRAYGPWNRNKLLEATKNESFKPLSYPVYMAQEWFPGMTQRLTFAVAGKSNDFETKLPLPALVYSLMTLTLIGLLCLLIQIGRRTVPWLTWFTLLLITVYVGVLSFQLYGDYVDTAEPVAINGRYLIPLLPLLSIGLIAAIRDVFKKVDSRTLAALSVTLLLLVIVSGGGAGTYIVLSETHWFWPGLGQQSHAFLQDIFTRFTLPYRY